MLESIPNVSEGSREAVIARLADAVRRPGVRLLDLSSDPDHDRTVLTLAGEAPALQAALLGLFEVAVAEIDLRRQRGVHPRIGAVDVVPFVPLDGTPMAAAVAAAEELAAAVARRFALPVYLYEEAARHPARRNLADVRRGGFEGFAGKVADPAWAPDFGPPRLHPTAGATAVGARFFLIAFNAVLDTPDVAVARRIARAVRESGGGLAAVKALGVALASRDRAQVSMNLVDFRRTSLARALERVRQEAEALGVRVVESELVGLVPEAALAAAAAELGMPPGPPPLEALARALRLPSLSPTQVLERRLATPD